MNDTTPGQQAGALEQQGPTPERIFQTFTAYQQTAALKAAVELDLFTAIGEGAATPASLAERTGAAERGLRILCDYLTIARFLSKEDGRYQLTPESAAFLDRRSPAYIGGMSGFLAGAELKGAFERLTESVRKGSTVMDAQGSMTPEHPMWEEFARSMASLMRMPAEQIAATVGASEMETCKVLDIAAGHGVFGVTIARHNPRAEVYAVDWANVLPYARQEAERAGVGERFHEIPGDAFEVEFGEGYDLVLITNFFHHFDRETCERLIRKVRAALKEGGRAVTLDFVPDEGRTTPPDAASFALIMLGTTERGDAYTFAEYERMFRAAGFGASEIVPCPPGHIIVTRK
ncbi:MAG TPA: class I SAM-dependent methyltransferase [Pyrinomonadaceae bacterium]|nr:class I SAM-dependent methyltransferase [Pyrinomonadaceae bacterium]